VTSRAQEPVRILTAADVHRCLTVSPCIDALDRAFQTAGSAEGGSFVGGMKTRHGKFHMKAAAARVERPLFAAKLNANFPDNPRTNGLPTIQGILVLCDADDGHVLAIMDSGAITAIRTAAASGVVARRAARHDARVLAVIGCGVQAYMHVDAMSAVRPIADVRAHDVDQASADRFVRAIRARGLDATAATDVAVCARGADIIVTCTTATTAFLGADHVDAGCFVAAVGTDNPEKSELMPDLLARAAVIVDDAAQCAAMGDLHHAIDAGAMQQSDVWCTMAELLLAPRPVPSDRPIVFDSTGIPLEDVAAAAAAYERATEADVGTILRLG
jgi:ornithine cyclodeaminase/alanine dehydrogenase-like protein (mu-crystallin family)